MAKNQPTVILFSCNWHPYSSLEAAGKENQSYSPGIYPVRLACLGRITPGIILNAFQKGAAGVYLAGCPQGECRHQSGSQLAEEVVQETSRLLGLLGYNPERLHLDLITADDSRSLVKNLELFIGHLEQMEGRG
jgi:coenzyme F420-reducing hydrogenase delta subunit